MPVVFLFSTHICKWSLLNPSQVVIEHAICLTVGTVNSNRYQKQPQETDPQNSALGLGGHRFGEYRADVSVGGSGT